MRTDYPRSESSRELTLPGAKVLSGNFRSKERKYRGAKSPDTSSSCPGQDIGRRDFSISIDRWQLSLHLAKLGSFDVGLS